MLSIETQILFISDFANLSLHKKKSFVHNSFKISDLVLDEDLNNKLPL